MEATPNNTPTNKLGSGLTEADILAAISKSGYPLQTIVGNFLGPQFRVQEEWSYIDRDTHENRTIDILAEKSLYDLAQGENRVRPTLDLLIECKQSALPYVFFITPNVYWIRDFPLLAGLFKHELSITTDDEASTSHLRILRALGLDSHPFIKEPEYCMSFTKCVRKGSVVELSGSEPFQGLILPILKAMHHFQIAESPPKTWLYFDCHLIIGIGILDAPMIGVHVSNKSQTLTFLPWVRVIRHETDELLDKHDKTKLFAIDIIHKDFLKDYLDKHVLPFAKEFSELAIKHQQVLASGEGFISGMGGNWCNDFERRLEPRKIRARVSRSKTIVNNIFKILTGRKL